MTLVSEDLLEAVTQLADTAGTAILGVYHGAGAIASTEKADGSPVTAADAAAEALIVAGLRRLTPEVPVVAEEAFEAGAVPDVAAASAFWLVDPLDGTREFLNRNGEFTVNIGLIEDGAPVLGVVTAPAKGWVYAGARGLGAAFKPMAEPAAAIAARTMPADGAVVVASRSHGDPDRLEAFLSAYTVAEERKIGSSLKLCLLAQGVADLYPRFGRTMEWDVAAGHAVLAAAGGAVELEDGTPLTYGKPGFDQPGFIAYGRRK